MSHATLIMCPTHRNRHAGCHTF